MQTQATLQALGYVVEDVGSEYGAPFVGLFRWLNPTHDGDGFGELVQSPEAAWQDAAEFEELRRG